MSETETEIARLTSALETLNKHKFMRSHRSTGRMMWFQFLRGLALGLGTALGASVLVSLIVLILTQISWVPVLGELATQVIEQIELRQ